MRSHGRAPPRSKRSELLDKGYRILDTGHFDSIYEARRVASIIRKNKKCPAQVVRLSGPAVADYGHPYIVMFKPKGGKR